MRGITLYSFDVFDTLITRPYARPVDLFRRLAMDILGDGVDEAALDAFALERINSEARARTHRGERDDITLAMIYEEFAKVPAYAGLADQAMTREVELELASVIAVRSMVDQVHDLMAGGHRVVAISDMYLPTHVVTAMLNRAGLALSDDAVYVSGEIGLSKRSGRLFDYVAQREGRAPGQCFHTGDNKKSDVERPRQRGWRASLCLKARENRFEVPATNDYWLTTRAAGVAKAGRLRNVSGNIAAAHIGSGVVGPLLCAFVAHVLFDARKQGLDTLYFVSRDGQIFLKIAHALQASGLVPEIECRYLYGSRQAWLLPSVTEATREQIGWAFPKGASSAPRDILRRLELEPSEFSQEASPCTLWGCELDAMQSEEEVDQFIGHLLDSPAAQRIVDRANERRRNLIGYLGEQGFLDPKRRHALVDVGWSLQSQAALRQCVRAVGHNVDVRGYYFGVSGGHAPLERVGEAAAFISTQKSAVPHRAEARWLFRLSTILLVEHLFTLADHPGVAHYQNSENGVVPLFKPNDSDARLIAFTHDLHCEVTAYAALAASSLRDELTSDAFLHWSLENVRRFVCEPNSEEVKFVEWLPANREITHDPRHTAQLASSLSLSDILKMVMHDLFPRRESFFASGYAWHDGAVAISPFYVRNAYWLLKHFKRVWRGGSGG
ncbi:hypothetical protein EZJ19_09175 [Parasulfuritortus cantonensis]|uniref:HAD family hydrolase n=1 Tax=Parasulfuritortus cantonensis TaxID=2528202 RepID=A0A4R1BCJ0_9PROT|nr:hypothetical protein [Parasulfuritortus cantonensis]TCJ14743.1 hypothetical protein EZJ19_09175 [Parasulfuritortus cantonensis]